jgi:hypothetical protein
MWMFQGRRGNQDPDEEFEDEEFEDAQEVEPSPETNTPPQGVMATSVDSELARLQRIIRSFNIENKELQKDLDKCHSELKKLSSRPVVQAELEPDLEVVQAELEPEPESEDLKTRGWVRFVGATTKYHGSSVGTPTNRQISNSDRIEWRDSHGEEYIKLTKKYAELAKPDAGPDEYFYLFECSDRTRPENSCRIPFPGHTTPENEIPLNAEDWLRKIDNMVGFGYPSRNGMEDSLRLIDKMKPGLLKELRIPAPTGPPPRYLPIGWKQIDTPSRKVTDYDIYVKPGVSLKVLSEKILELKTPREFSIRKSAAFPEGIAKTDPKHHPRLIIVVENEEDRQNLIEINPEIQKLILPWNSLEELNSVPLEEIRLWFRFNAADFERVAEREGYNRKYVEIFLPHLFGLFNQKASMKSIKTKKKKKPKKTKKKRKTTKNRRK